MKILVDSVNINEVEHGIVVRFSRVSTIVVWIDGQEFAVYVGHTVFQSAGEKLMTDSGVVKAATLVATALEQTVKV